MMKAALIAAFALLSQHAGAVTPTRYLINHWPGDGQGVTGTIVTDGTMGILGNQNILDWDLTLNADADQTTVGRLLGPLSGGNSTLSLTPTFGLSFDALYAWPVAFQTSGLFFNSAGGASHSWQILEIVNRDGSVVWQMNALRDFSELIRESNSLGNNPVQTYFSYRPELVELGKTVSAVPESSTVWLLVLGFPTLLLVIGRRLRGQQTRRLNDTEAVSTGQ